MTRNPDPFVIEVEGETLHLKAMESLSAAYVYAQRAVLIGCLDQAAKAVVLDLSASEMVDSLGITLIVGLHKSCKEKGLAFAVEGANAEVTRLFKIFCLDEIFEIREGRP